MPGSRTNPTLDRNATSAGQRFKRRIFAAVVVAVRVDRVLVDTDKVQSPDVDVTQDGDPVELPEMISDGESLNIEITFDEFDCADARTEAASVEVRAKPLLPLQAKKDIAVHGLDGHPDVWLANATRAACDAVHA